MNKFLLTSACALIVSATSLFAAKPGWSDDYDKSLAKATNDKKLVLLNFTGSDWCGWCIKIDKEVFQKADFKKLAREKLVLVEADYPQGFKLSKKTAQQNEALKLKYAVRGYPTNLLLNNEGKVLAAWGGYSPTFLEELEAKIAEATPTSE